VAAVKRRDLKKKKKNAPASSGMLVNNDVMQEAEREPQ